MAYAPGNFCWYECGTTDAAAARRFYCDVFGWSAVEMPMPEGVEGSYTMLRLGDADIAGLYEMSGPMFAGVPSHWMSYVSVTDADRSVDRARELGGEVVVAPVDVPGVGRIAFLADPAGARFALFQPGGHSGAASLGAVAGTFGWCELATSDVDSARRFYAELFGWTAQDSQSADMPYTEWVVEGRHIGGMMPLTPQHGDAPPHWMPYVLVDDCDATMQKVESAGGSTCVPPMDIPDVGRFALFNDPTGAVLAIVHLQQARDRNPGPADGTTVS
jgi:hypothetical protein